MAMGIQGAGMENMQQMREHMQLMQNFQSGQVNLTKEDILEMEEHMASSGVETPDDFVKISDSFDEIDTNGDGISIDEMNSFTQSTGISFGPGQPPPGMFGQGKPPGGMGGHGGPPPAQSSEDEDDEEQSYIDKLLESYSSYDSDSLVYQTMSFSA